MKQIIENQDKFWGGINQWMPLVKWTVGAVGLVLLMPAVLALGYFVAVLCLIAVPLSSLGLLLAYLMASAPHTRWGTTLRSVEDIQPNVISLDKYIKENRSDRDVFLAS